MRDQLYSYYETELAFFREMAKEYAQEHSKVARRLKLDGDVPDPHVERLIQAFALIAGRIRLKLDDEFPEITAALLEVLYPHYLRPVPSMGIAQFELDPEQGKASGGYTVKRGTELHTRSVPGAGMSCRFRTCYPATLWPIQIVSAQVVAAGALPSGLAAPQAAAAIRLGLKCHGDTSLSTLKPEALRFHLAGRGVVPQTLYELILNNAYRVALCTGEEEVQAEPAIFPAGSVRAVGFERHEGLLPYPDRSFLGYRLLQEYFCFPEKFLFFDLTNFQKLPLQGFSSQFEIIFLLSQFERKERLSTLERAVRPEHFQLGCTPVVNLFPRPAEPITVTHTAAEYRVVPDRHSPLATEVYSVDRVLSEDAYAEGTKEYQPFYSVRHHYDEEPSEAFWYARRAPSARKGDPGTEVYLSLVDVNLQAARLSAERLAIDLTCTNRDLPAKLPLSEKFGELSFESAPGIRARVLGRLTESIRPTLGSGLQWRLISHLSLNYLLLVEGGCDSLREILRLYDFGDSPDARNRIAGIAGISSRPRISRVISEMGVAFAPGVHVNVLLDEERYSDGGVFLMASVLERFLALYASVNSFTQLAVATKQRKEVLRQWTPRAGEQVLL